MNTTPGDDRFAPPQAPVADIDPQEGLGLASRWSRLGAAIIDVIALMVVMWLLSKFTPWNPFAAPRGDFWLSVQPLQALGGFGVFVLVQGYLLVTRGQTIGKLALGLRIVRPDGSAASLGRLLGLRYGVASVINIVPALGQIYGLLDCLFIFHSSRRCLHDRIADTIVVKA